MNRSIVSSLVLLVYFGFVSLGSEETDLIDDTIASGVVFKLINVLEANGAAKYEGTNNSESYTRVWEAIRLDLASLSESERGVLLNQKGNELIDDLILLVNEDEKILSDAGLDAKDPDPIDLALLVTEKIGAYGKLARTPEWVYERGGR